MTWVFLAFVIATTMPLYTRLVALNAAWERWDDGLGKPRVRERLTRRMTNSVALWQISIGVFLIHEGQGASTVGLFGVAAMLLAQNRLQRMLTHNLP